MMARFQLLKQVDGSAVFGYAEGATRTPELELSVASRNIRIRPSFQGSCRNETPTEGRAF